jgi:hypothetical protein
LEFKGVVLDFSVTMINEENFLAGDDKDQKNFIGAIFVASPNQACST